MTAAGHQIEAEARLFLRLGLRQNPATNGDHSIGGEHILTRSRDDGSTFRACESDRMRARKFFRLGGLVEIGGGDARGHHPNLGQQGQPSRASGGENQGQNQLLT